MIICFVDLLKRFVGTLTVIAVFIVQLMEERKLFSNPPLVFLVESKSVRAESFHEQFCVEIGFRKHLPDARVEANA